MNPLSMIQNMATVILADGTFPAHHTPLSELGRATRIICCDGAAEHLLEYGFEPSFIVGDMDSLSGDLKKKYASVIFPSSDQNTNDLTKAVRFCMDRGWNEITIIGATGKREDHTIANLSLLVDYGLSLHVQLLTDYGVFTPQYSTTIYESYRGQQVSIFSLKEDTRVTTRNLCYPITDEKLVSWWSGTLNESASDTFEIIANDSKLLIFREY